MSNAISGVGLQFQRENDGSSGLYTTIAEVNNISGPGNTRAFIDVTSFDSTGGYREFITGFRDGGQFIFNMNFTADGYGQMLVDFEYDDAINYQMVLPNTAASVVSFAGYVTDCPIAATMDDKVTVAVTIKITGQVSFES